jgi:hypothetical protein
VRRTITKSTWAEIPTAYASGIGSITTISQLSIRAVEQNDALDIATRIENPNLTCAKACALQRIIDRLIFLGKHRLDAGNLKSFPAPPVRSDFNRRHCSERFASSDWLGLIDGSNRIVVVVIMIPKSWIHHAEREDK